MKNENSKSVLNSRQNRNSELEFSQKISPAEKKSTVEKNSQKISEKKTGFLAKIFESKKDKNSPKIQISETAKFSNLQKNEQKISEKTTKKEQNFSQNMEKNIDFSQQNPKENSQLISTKTKILKSNFFCENTPKIKYPPLNAMRKRNDKIVLNIANILLLIGLVMIVSSSYGATKTYSLSNFHFALKHLTFCGLSLFCMRFFSRKLDWLDTIGKVFWIGSIIGLVIVLFFSHSMKGASRWISILGFSIQPSEFAKIGVILEGAKYIEKNWSRFFAVYAIPMGLIILQPDLGNTVLLLGLATAQVITKKFNLKYIFYGFAIFVALLSVAYLAFPHVQNRIHVFLNPNEDLFGIGYQRYKSFLAMKNGGLFGRGFGKGIIKDFLPDAHTDFIFSVIIEEFGIIAGFFVIGLFIALAWRVLKLLAKDPYIQMVQYSILVCILASAWLNIASTLSLIPTKGLTLPLISYGGSGLIVQGILFGILLAITKSPNKFSSKKLHAKINTNDEEE